ncbi:MAG TPA: M56 family metallopeptidase [Candidatus Elarobacter sp.]|nr:M56 family metallopeptidase [Candidatus Elarobacter sp.]
MDALLLAILNALWQGAALIALVALALRWGLRRNATTACVVWSVAFVVVALLPALDFALARPAVVPAVSPFEEQVSVRVAGATPRGATTQVDPMTATSARGPRAASSAEAPYAASAVAPRPSRAAAMLERARDVVAAGVLQIGVAGLLVGETATALARSFGFAIVCAWALVAAFLLLRLARSYAAIAAMKRDATPLDDPAVLARLRAAGHRRRAGVACSPHVTIPCAVGFSRPMILIPTGLAASLDVDDLARVVLHESAHLQRYDDWINALEQVVCALQFFQPALFVARRSIDFEREVACDDRVLEDAGEPLRYAECLARIVQRHVRGPRAAVVPGFVLRRTQVVARVRRIVDRSRDASPHLRIGALALGGGVLVATLGIARLQVPLVAPALAMTQPATSATLVTEDASALVTEDGSALVTGDHTAHNNARHQKAHGAQHRNAHARQAHHANVAQLTAVAAPALIAAKPSPSPSPAAVRAKRATPPAADRAVYVIAPEARANAAAYGVRAAAPAPAARQAASSAVLYAPEASGASAGEGDGTGTSGASVATAAARSAYANAASAAARAPAVAPVAAARAAYAEAQGQGQAAPTIISGQGSSTIYLRGSHRDGDLLDAIDEAKYPHPSVDELIALRNQGVGGDYIRKMGALGRPRPSLHEILALAVQGISPEYIATLDKRLASPPSFDRIIALRVQGVSATWLDQLAAIGYPKLSTDDAVALAVQGVRASYVRGLMDAGMRSLTPAQLVQLRVMGVDGTFVRRLAAHGYKNLDVDALVRLKASGFEP